MNRGCQVIIQGEWSSQLKACMSLFNDRKIIDLAPGSQSDELAIAGDYIFRLPPPSSKYAPAHKATLLDFGTKAVIMIYTMETFGQGLYQAIRAQYEAEGINVSYAIGVDPVGHDFAAEIGAVVPYYDSAVAVYGKENVSIEISGADPPTTDLIESIAMYPHLQDARLLIHDAYCTGLLERAAPTAAKMRTIGYLLTPPRNPLTQEFHDYIKATKGYEAYAYAYTANDCLWIAVLSMLAAGKYNGEAMAKVLPQIADSFFGLSGWTKLNEAGDRAYGTFTISQVQTLQNGTAIWKDLGIYDGTSGIITWESPPL
jgi:branched-chain amino acid transport system substrate-binding protein